MQDLVESNRCFPFLVCTFPTVLCVFSVYTCLCLQYVCQEGGPRSDNGSFLSESSGGNLVWFTACSCAVRGFVGIFVSVRYVGACPREKSKLGQQAFGRFRRVALLRQNMAVVGSSWSWGPSCLDCSWCPNTCGILELSKMGASDIEVICCQAEAQALTFGRRTVEVCLGFTSHGFGFVGLSGSWWRQ